MTTENKPQRNIFTIPRCVKDALGMGEQADDAKVMAELVSRIRPVPNPEPQLTRCKCRHCKQLFIGHKRRVACRKCTFNTFGDEVPTTATQEKPCQPSQEAQTSTNDSLLNGSGSTEKSTASRPLSENVSAPADDAWAMEKVREVVRSLPADLATALIDWGIDDAFDAAFATALKEAKEKGRSIARKNLLEDKELMKNARDDARRKAADASKELAEAHRVIAEYAGRIAAGDLEDRK